MRGAASPLSPPPLVAARGAWLTRRAFRWQLATDSCLPRALVQWVGHGLEGGNVVLRIGVRRPDEAISLDAHAWVDDAEGPPGPDALRYRILLERPTPSTRRPHATREEL
jgi:hypothetical protein